MLRFLPLQAYTNPHSKYIIIIDEINRGNLAKIFGELVYSLEYRGKVGHEGQEVILPYSNDKFIVPENIWIIATMNSAD